MEATKFCEFGLGDSATWPPFAGHPHDPRAPLPDEDPTMDAINYVRGFLTIAEVAAKKGDLGKARHALAEACKSIREFIGEDQ